MKKYLLFFLSTIFLLSCSKNENEDIEKIYEGNIKFLTQKEVDDFGKEGYTEIIGNVNIGEGGYPSNAITNLKALESIERITGDLWIIKNASINNLEGLHNLKNVDVLRIQNNDALVNLDGLKSLDSVKTYLGISTNYSLNDLSGLRNLSYSKFIGVGGNENLEEITGFENISLVPDYLGIENNIKLKSLEGFTNIKEVGELLIAGNSNLRDIDDFSNLERVNGDLTIDEDSLLNINGLINVKNIGKSLTLRSNYLITNLNGLNGLETVGESLNIEYNQKLIDVSALQNLTHIGNRLVLLWNNELPNLIGLENLSNVQQIEIVGHENLGDYCGLLPLFLSGFPDYDNNQIFRLSSNKYMPTVDNMKSGNCSQ